LPKGGEKKREVTDLKLAKAQSFSLLQKAIVCSMG